MSEQSIPHVIHYCWFGNAELGELEEKCLASWAQFCPDYAIERWNESNFDVTCNDFVAGAYQNKKWAFVSDYARFKILYERGGVYLDTDVELVKSLNSLVGGGAYLGYETDPDEVAGKNGTLAAGLGMAFPAGHPFLARVLDVYESVPFPDEGNLGDYTVVRVVTKLLEEDGLRPILDGQVVDGVTLLPRRYLNPMDRFTGSIEVGPDTVSIHHYSASWISRSARTELKVSSFLIRVGMPRERALRLAKYVAVLLCFDVDRMRSFLGKGARDE